MLGSGTALDPYQVATAQDLYDVNNDPEAFYIQTADIDLSGYADWLPIGKDSTFLGGYDGNDFIISGLTIIDNNANDVCGLFGYANATLANIKLRNISLNLKSPTGFYEVGGLVPWLEGGSITNCSVTGIMNIIGVDRAGGLVGIWAGEPAIVTDCWADVDITITWEPGYGEGSYDIGGLIGCINGEDLAESLLTNCYATGDIISIVTMDDTDQWVGVVGGLAGWTDNVTISKCYATGDVSGWEICGGFIGECWTDTLVSNCYSSGNVVMPVDFDTYMSSSIASYFDMNGGFIGVCRWDDSIVITNCYSSGSVYDPNVANGGFSDASLGDETVFDGCFYDYTVAPISDLFATPKTTAEMKAQETYTGWDFDTVWLYTPGQYPTLKGAVFPLQTRKAYAYVAEDPTGSMTYDGKVYKFVKWLEEFEATTHPTAGISTTYEYGGPVVTYSEVIYSYIASGITDPEGPGGYGSYLPDTSRTVLSLADRENHVNFYYIALSAPTITTDSIASETANGFVANITISSNGGAAVSNCGFVWGTTTGPTVAASAVVDIGPKAVGSYAPAYSGADILADTTYYVRAFAINSQGVAYGAELTFIINSALAEITTDSVTEITAEGFTVGYSVDALNDKMVTTGFVWGTAPSPSLDDGVSTTVPVGVRTIAGPVSYVHLAEVTADVTYYLAAYATNVKGTAYGADISFVLDSKFNWEFIATPVHNNLLEMDGNGTYHLSLAEQQALHAHSNKAVVDDLTDSGGELLYKGLEVGAADLETHKTSGDHDSRYALAFTKGIPFCIVGALTIALKSFFTAPCAMTVTGGKLEVGTASTGLALICDIHKNGTTLFTTQGNRPTIADGSTSAAITAPDVVSIAQGDRIDLNIDQIGSSVAGSDLSLTLYCT